MDFEFDDQERFCATPKLPLFSIPFNRACDTPGLATPPVNIAGSVPFLWEEAPGKPRVSDENKPLASKQNEREGGGGGVVRCLELPPRLFFPADDEPSPTTVLDGPYDVPRRSLSVIRRSERASEGRFEFSRSTNSRCCDGGGGTTVKISRVRRKGSLLNLSHSKSQFLARVYQGFKQVIPWRRRQENLPRMSSSNI
ncbi:hypothetical protein AtNW77_Chr4g0305621 [Arabidopsis thaliana]|jgi:hypothetical protein|uniref:Uncharacterized protein n=4 Tax=Arabidopsis TaxID=3701 RepID=Q5S4T5_ARATH|nr:uncharacterized protein AT4G27810 [Arabidopsis thaliana]KAG7617592.1 hypothetical protein ISN45_At04g029370 [Arabidopsis thaliana x Arabidopsis arenosa]KAG7622048.1 hypothetical protein ISN44_As04g028780 [Arabidopsis suecica]AAV63919.1 hypothetical protein [Arabidopsis thaliana]AEE85396.1 hypothetical protein AT4G27810 [Arabidopsis thaliana]OAP01038.1 hypothetical protein AXX17_AT4G32030 [Arabidopsis thaliana]|eukprot:NP_194510.2 hypothetical protein AT4G27810 [Arabidopsis thaliana]